MTAGRARLVVRGEVRVPGDKSVSHRALMFGALADGRSSVRGILQSADIESTAGALRALGWHVPDLAPVMEVHGQGLGHQPDAISHLDLGNSGTSTRLLMGVVAGYPVAATFTGDASLSRRPMRRVATPLTEMGARVDILERNDAGAEPLGDLAVRPVHLAGTRIDGDEIPSLIDELPALACVAARAHGETVIAGAAELRVKESDRIAAVVSNLRAIGVDAEETPDGMRIRGTREPLTGRVQTHQDHRLAMAFGVLGATAQANIEIDEPDCVAVSYPGFWHDLAHVAG